MKNIFLMRNLLFVGLLCAIVIAILFRDQLDGVALEAWVRDTGLVALLLFLPGCVIALAFLPRLMGILRRGPMINTDSFRQKLDTDEDLLVLDVRGGMTKWIEAGFPVTH